MSPCEHEPLPAGPDGGDVQHADGAGNFARAVTIPMQLEPQGTRLMSHSRAII